MILVIGATSFIGVYTVDELLKENKEVIVAGRNNKMKEYYKNLGVEYINFDLSCEEDYEKLPQKNIDAVILLAGLLPANANVDINNDDNAFEYIKVNTLGTGLLLEYCRKNDIKKLISTTSYADVFNAWNENKAITEEEPRDYNLEGDHAAYVVSKNAATDLMLYYNNQHGMSNCIFRLPPVYGVGPHGTIYVDGKLQKSGVQVFIDKASLSEDIIIHGDGNLKRDVIYVKDVARAFNSVIESETSKGLYNMTSGIQVTLKEQVEIIVELFSDERNSNKSKIFFDLDRVNNSKSYLFSMEKAKNDFGFTPMYRDFRIMMSDYKEEMNGKYRELFK